MKYTGAFKNDVYDGRGEYITNDGGRYEGMFAGGVMHGRGIKTGAFLVCL